MIVFYDVYTNCKLFEYILFKIVIIGVDLDIYYIMSFFFKKLIIQR